MLPKQLQDFFFKEFLSPETMFASIQNELNEHENPLLWKQTILIERIRKYSSGFEQGF